MLNNCVVQTQTFQTFTSLYLTPPVYIRLWLWIRIAKLLRAEAGSFSKSERQTLQRLFTQGCAAYGSLRNLVKDSNLSVSKVRHLLHSKASYTKFTSATRNFKRMKAFAWFKTEIRCMDLAYVDKLAIDNNGVKYLLVRQDLFDRTLDAKGMKTKDSKETLRVFQTMITRKRMNRTKKFWFDKGTDFAGKLKKIMQNWRNTNLLCNEWVRGRICWTYSTIPEKHNIPLNAKQWTSTFTNWLTSF